MFMLEDEDETEKGKSCRCFPLITSNANILKLHNYSFLYSSLCQQALQGERLTWEVTLLHNTLI